MYSEANLHRWGQNLLSLNPICLAAPHQRTLNKENAEYSWKLFALNHTMCIIKHISFKPVVIALENNITFAT